MRVHGPYKFGKWYGEDDKGSEAKRFFSDAGEVNIKTGFVCKECKKSVLAYKQPKKCKEHE